MRQEVGDAPDQPVALLAVGVDNLLGLEELFGEALGEGVMGALHQRFMTIVPRIAEISETQQRRFLITLPGFDALAVQGLMQQLQAAASGNPIVTTGGLVAVTVSGGCAFAPAGAGLADAKAPALHALHTAMGNAIGTLRIAKDDRALLDYRTRLMSVSRATIGALGTEYLTIAFQPVVRASGTHVISYHECLVRLRQQSGALLTAASFMPEIERLGLASLIDRQVIAMTLEALRRHPCARFAVNIFPQTMQDRAWMQIFERAVALDPSLAERLIVEVTETAALLDTLRTREFMDRLRAFGVSFAIDDFGAGHTSLRHLREFRFDIMKIDGRFIRHVDQDPDGAFLVESLVRIAERFDMMTVAEAIQTQAEARCLKSLGVEFFQGFQFGSPSLKLEPTLTPMPAVAAQA